MSLKRWTNEGYRQLTDSEIKTEIMRRWGLDPANKADQIIYKRRYDVYRLRVKNYVNLINIETPIRPNESLLRTLTRQQNGIQLTAEQEGILNTSAQNTTKFKRRIAKSDPTLIQSGIDNLEKEFKNFLEKNTRGYEIQYKNFVTTEVTYIDIIDKDGVVQAHYNISNGEQPPTEEELKPGFTKYSYSVREYRDDLTIAEVKEYLEALAADLHSWQMERMQANGTVSKAARKQIGS